jgi:cyclohexanecarboxyl-CoA dehydrogenase
MILTEEQRAFQDIARRFAQERLAPGYVTREREAVLDRGLVKEMGSLGLVGPDMPAAFGGIDASGVVSGIIMEEVAGGDFNVGYVQLLASLVGGMLVRHAAEALVAEWVPRIVAGTAIVGLALTEPRGGSDAANLVLRAERRGENFVLNGEKNSISFADQADAFVVFARTGVPGGGAHGVSAFFVPADSPGLGRTRLNCIGSKLIGRGSLFFDDVPVAAANMMGRENAGFVQVMQGFDYSRALIGLQCVGAAQASLDEAWDYTQQRQAFGGPIAQYQGVTFPLAEGDTIIAAARQLCYHTLSLRDAGIAHTAEAAMCKWLAPKSAVDVIHQCLLTFGHYGWTMDTPHQQRLRDVMGLEIGDGTAQIMKLVIARERVGRVAVQYARPKHETQR